MRSRPTFWILLSLLLLGGAWLFWSHDLARKQNSTTQKIAAQQKTFATPSFTTTRSASTAPRFLAGKISTNAVSTAAKTNQFPYRLANTKKSIGELVNDRRAILLENALIDTGAKLDLAIPKNLQAQGDPGAYIVQARGPIDAAFRAQLAAAGAQIISYIPNDAYLVRISSGGANELAAQPLTQSVIPYEPYYKLTASLLDAIAKSEPVSELKVAVYPDTADQAKSMIENAGMTISATDPSPFGPVFTVQNVSDVAAVAQMSVVQLVEPVRQRIHANDLSRQATGVSLDSVTTTTYLNLNGANVMVEVNDSGIDATHPDLVNRVFGAAGDLVDTDGHGTFVAGQIAGDGTESMTVTNAQGSIITNMPGPTASPRQFRGKAPLATLLSMDLNNSDETLQAAAALTNALISNNSWNFDGDNAYDLEAASYDAAVRDALPLVTGSQPVLFVFSAGNDGGGDDFGGGGSADTILSPATAKNVITIGALQQARDITNIVTDINGNSNAVWEAGTQNGNLVAGYSSRGNVGIGTEGPFGRFKPDVVAPGSFVVSTRSQQWDEAAYYNPTNFYFESFDDQFVSANSQNNYSLSLNFVPPNTTFNSNIVGVNIFILPNADSPSPFPVLPVYVSHINFPDPAIPTTFDFVTMSNQVSIPPDGGASYLSQIQNGNLFYAVANTNSERVGFDIVEEITATNEAGNYFTVLSNLNNSLGGSPDSLVPPHYYRYESGTSMAAADTSGVLALMQEFFTNSALPRPSPALLKAMLINGARTTGSYNFNIATTDNNFEGWGLINLPDSLPAGVTNQIGASCSSFFLDQSPTNALATGDSQTFMVTVDTNDFADAFPLQVTLAWTDPPGNPAAAIKLVNNLDVVVTNLDDPANPIVYFGNDIAPDSQFNAPWDTNTTPNLDSINNVENIIIPPVLGGKYSVTVIGRSVNVNAVTAQTNNVVQDYALVIACSAGEVTTAITVTPNPIVSNPTSDQQITIVGVNTNGMATNSISSGGVFLDQLAGANTPLLGTNKVELGGTNELVTLGMTNQWHFYVVPNGTTFTNAAFVTFLPDTLAIPRMGVFADSDANSTQPEADIDLYVSTDPSLTNLDPVVISNCVNGTQVGASVTGTFNGASLGRGGTEFVVDTNSTAGQVYYVGVKSETAEAAEYGFLPVFSQQPFSQMQNGNEVVNGLLLPMPIPDGSPAHPGTAYIFALAVQPIEAQDVIVSNQIVHQNFGDLTGTLNHNGTDVVLNNHDSLGNPPGPYNFTYDDGTPPVAGSQPPDGPGSLQSFQGQQAIGPWILTEVDNSLTQTGAVTGFSLLITPHQDLTKGINVLIPPGGITNFFIDVPVGTTNLTISATNTTLPNPDTTFPFTLGELFERFDALPTPQQPPPPTNFDQMVLLTNFPPALSVDPGNTISVGQTNAPPIQPGRYFATLYNPSTTLAQNFFIIASFGVGQIVPVDFSSGGPVPLLDDAVTYAFITNTPTATFTNATIAAINVGIRVDHPRISDLVFHLISPDGTRFLLMENRGGTSTNGAGVTIFTTNAVQSVASGNNASDTNVINVGETSGTFPISYNFFTVPDQMTVYYGTNLVPANLIYNSGSVSGSNNITVSFPPASPTDISSNLTIVMNQFGNTNTSGDLWTYTAGGVTTNYFYLVFTEDTNLTTTPIKFAPPPFVPAGFFSTNFTFSDFESAAPGDSVAPSTVSGTSWTVISNQVSVVKDPATANQGSQFLALANGVISTNLPTVPGVNYAVSFAYRGPGIVSWWRAENNNASDSVGTNNGTLSGATTFGTGEVGQGFVLDGNNGSGVALGNPASLQLQDFTIEMWIKRGSDTVVSFGSGGNANLFGWGLGGYLFGMAANGELFFDKLGDISPQQGPFVTDINFHHVALTKVGGKIVFYLDGTAHPIPTSYANTFTFTTSIGLGYRSDNNDNSFLGVLDEASFYNRALSASEISAIYTNGAAGKFNPVEFSTSPAQSLAEASVAISGVTTNVIFGNNTSWQAQNISFKATQNATPLTLAGLEPGMLLDSFSVSGTGGGANLYYLPEESLDPLIGTSAFGTWTLEIQDDRVGATNNAVLDSWQLQFVFANTNPIPAVNIPTPINLTNGAPLTNVVPANSTAWFLVTVPPNADIATNDLIFATAPVNLLFNPSAPDTNGDFTLLPNATSGISILTTSSAPTNIVPGGIYFLGVQNTNPFAVTNAIEVTFHLIAASPPFAFTQPAQSVTGTNAQLNGMATPNGLPATAWFEWGTNTSYGNQTPPVSVGNSFNVVYTNSQISGLVMNVPYHFRLVVSNAFAVVDGFDQIFDEANVVVWGANFAGQKIVPPGVSNMVAIAGAYDHSLALRNNGTAVVWGDNTFNQTNVPAALNTNLVAVAGGESYSIALKNSGTVVAWGENIFPGETNVPAGLNNVVTIASGQYTSLALQNNGTVVAWGANISGLTNVPAALSNTVAIAGGSFHNLALKNDGTVVAWGDDSVGQTNVPAGLTNVVAISGGSFHSLALQNNGTVVAWGDDTAGQTDVPASLTNVVAIAAGGFHSLALKNDGTVVAWGDDSAGQSSVPVGLSNVVAIAGGNLHSLALTPLFNVNSTNPIVLSITNGAPQTNSILPGGITFYQINVPVNADFATNILLFADGPLNILFTTNTPPTTNAATVLMANSTNGISVLSTTSTPTNITPGAVYYLGVQNTNSFTVTYGIEVDFHLLTPPPVVISSIIQTNINGTNGFLLTWFAPSNDLFQVQWNDNLGSTNWTTFTNPPVISYNTNIFPVSPTNAQFNFFDDGSQTPPGLPPIRFYRLILLQSANPSAASVSISGITSTNVSGTNGFLLTWFAPSNDLFQVQWITNLASTNWGTFTNIISYNTNFAASAASAQFNFFDDGSQTGGTLSAMRFYRLILLQGINSLTLPNQTNFTASLSATVTVTNTAVDSKNNAVLTYSLTNSPANASISTNGIITWTNATPSGLAAHFNTVVTDNGVPPLTATNTFTIFVAPIPSITNVTVTPTNVVLQWVAPTNDQFQVQSATNLAPPIIWTLFPNVITSTNGLFIFTDTNAPLLMKFYQLILLP